jgi:hypothetical protein
VPDDLIGARIRCPHCGELIVIEAKDCEGPSVHVQQGMPPGAPDPKEASNLENQIYDGLPPLSVMLALRRRKGGPAYDQEELNRRYPMTDDDWRALAAFEKALHASAALTTAFWFGLMALAGNTVLWYGALGFHRSAAEQVPPMRLLWVLSSGVTIIVGVTSLHVGAKRLGRIMLGAFLSTLPWLTLGLSALFGGTAVWSVNRMFSGDLGDWPPAIVAVAANGVAFLATCAAAIRVWRALPKLRPPEIAHRLTEALKYLA